MARPRSLALFLLGALSMTGPLAGAAAHEPEPQALRPPVAKRVPHVRALHGDRFEDPWFWLRERENPEVRAYLEAENAYTEAMTKPAAALEEKLYAELVSRLKEDDEGVPYPKGAWHYFWRTEKGQQHRTYLRRPAAGGADQALVDLNELGRGEKFVSLGAFEVSDDGSRLAYSIDVTGFREYRLFVKEIATGRLLGEPIADVTSVAWAADGRTLLFTTEDAAKRSHRVWRRPLEGGADALVYEEADERFSVRVERSRSGAWLFLTSASHTTSEVRLIDAARPAAEPRLVETRVAGHEYYLDHAGDQFFVRSNAEGRNFALYRAPVAGPGRGSWQAVRRHDPAVMLEGVDAFAGHLVLTERAAGLPRFRIVELSALGATDGGRDRFVPMPEAAYAAWRGPNEEFETRIFRYLYESPTTPDSVYDYALADGSSTLLKRDEVPGYDPARYRVERIEATAPDGTRVPVTLTSRLGLARDGRNPALLRGYGSYGYASALTFDSAAVSLLDRGFVVATAHIRGGGELGKSWHDQGRMKNKVNTFTDFVACAEELVRRGYTSSERLAIAGGSAGGLLMGAAVNLRPDLFAVVLSYVPFVDVVNSMSDATLPLTVGEFEEWGNPQVEEQYRWMIAYSPYENLAVRAYPAMLVRTSFWDSQVMYWEPAKYVARLRTLKTDTRPLLLLTNLDAGGHGGFAGRYDKLRDTAFDWAFLLGQLGLRE